MGMLRPPWNTTSPSTAVQQGELQSHNAEEWQGIKEVQHDG